MPTKRPVLPPSSPPRWPVRTLAQMTAGERHALEVLAREFLSPEAVALRHQTHPRTLVWLERIVTVKIESRSHRGEPRWTHNKALI